MQRDVILTPEGLEKLKKEIEELSTVKRREVAERIKEAREFGDISETARFLVVEPGDGLATLHRSLGFSVFQNAVDGCRFGEPGFTPSWEWIEDHGCCFEFVFIMDDSGFGHVVIVEKKTGVPRRLLDLCETHLT